MLQHQVVNTSSCKACSATENSVALHCISVCLPRATSANLMNYLAMPCSQAHANTIMEFCIGYGYSQMFTIFLPLSAQILCKLQEEQLCHHYLLHYKSCNRLHACTTHPTRDKLLGVIPTLCELRMLSGGKVRATVAISSLVCSCWCKSRVTTVGRFTLKCCQERTRLRKLRKN